MAPPMLLLLLAATSTSALSERGSIEIEVDPLRSGSLHTAVQQARALAGAAVTLRLLPGVHDLSTVGPLVLDSRDAGTTLEGTGAVITGGQQLDRSSWTAVPESDPVYKRLPADARSHVVRAQVPNLAEFFQWPGPRGRGAKGYRRPDGSIDPVPCGPITELWAASSEPMRVARYPNVDHAGDEGGPGWMLTQNGSNASGFAFPAGTPVPANATGTFAAGYWWLDWSDATIPVTSIEANFAYVPKQPLYVNESSKGAGFPAGSRFFFLNQPEYLDSPGEYFLVPTAGTAYAWPPSATWDGASISSAQELITLLPGADGVTFRGVTFEAAQWHGIRCGSASKYPLASDCGANNVTIDSCTIKGIGSAGIAVMGATGWKILNSTISHTHTHKYMYTHTHTHILTAHTRTLSVSHTTHMH
eukprot:COSAG02_NODE_9052_length_2347_cov_29.692171_2_plen_416_part_01